MKKRILYGCIVVVCIILIVYSVIVIKRGRMIKIDSPLIEELDKAFRPSKETTFLNELYQENGFTNEYVLAIGAKNYLQERTLETIPSDALERSIHEMFGENTSFEHNNFYLFSNGICGYTYNKETKSYEQIVGCGGNNTDFYKTKKIEANRLGKKLTIKEAVLYFSVAEKTSIYTSFTKEELLAEVENNIEEEEEYFAKGSVYEYTFEFVNKKYILKEVNRIQ